VAEVAARISRGFNAYDRIMKIGIWRLKRSNSEECRQTKGETQVLSRFSESLLTYGHFFIGGVQGIAKICISVKRTKLSRTNVRQRSKVSSPSGVKRVQVPVDLTTVGVYIFGDRTDSS
jgi:hypothetical protein